MQFSRLIALAFAFVLSASAWAGTIPLLGAGGKASGGGASGLTLEFLTSAVNATSQTVYTFAAQPVGTASADRRIIVGFSERVNTTPATVTSLTVCGVTAGSLVQVVSGAGSINRTALFSALVTTGTTCDVVVTLSGAALRAGIGVWSIKGPLVTVDANSSITNPASVTMTIPASGAAIAYSFAADGAAPRTSTWTGLAENFDTVITTNFTHSGASSTTPGSTLMTDTYSGTPSLGNGVVFATFGP